jgi:hypothetical protein
MATTKKNRKPKAKPRTKPETKPEAKWIDPNAWVLIKKGDKYLTGFSVEDRVDSMSPAPPTWGGEEDGVEYRAEQGVPLAKSLGAVAVEAE